MAPPDAQPPEEPRQEPPYWPWPGEQIPYRRAEHPTVDAHFTEDSPPPPRPRRRWLPVGAVLVAVTGITTAALLLTQSGEPGPDDSGGTTGLYGPGDDITPRTSEPWETTSEPHPPTDPPDSSSPVDPTPTEDDEPSPPVETQEVYVDNLSVGDCVDEAERTSYYVIVPCEGEHERQTLDLATLDDRAEYPGEEVVAEEARALCWDSYSLASSDWPAEEEELLYYDKVTPSSSTWAEGDRTVICLLKTLDGSPLQKDFLSG
ncbi:septum formation family protein [Streptomyces sp. CA-135486]|uniref:septum formation family protein n=1 Tax=Streptomyces sp. CA-135486 TaxID=3240049 RepID=UPI003D92DE98